MVNNNNKNIRNSSTTSFEKQQTPRTNSLNLSEGGSVWNIFFFFFKGLRSFWKRCMDIFREWLPNFSPKVSEGVGSWKSPTHSAQHVRSSAMKRWARRRELLKKPGTKKVHKMRPVESCFTNFGNHFLIDPKYKTNSIRLKDRLKSGFVYFDPDHFMFMKKDDLLQYFRNAHFYEDWYWENREKIMRNETIRELVNKKLMDPIGYGTSSKDFVEPMPNKRYGFGALVGGFAHTHDELVEEATLHHGGGHYIAPVVQDRYAEFRRDFEKINERYRNASEEKDPLVGVSGGFDLIEHNLVPNPLFNKFVFDARQTLIELYGEFQKDPDAWVRKYKHLDELYNKRIYRYTEMDPCFSKFSSMKFDDHLKAEKNARELHRLLTIKMNAAENVLVEDFMLRPREVMRTKVIAMDRAQRNPLHIRDIKLGTNVTGAKEALKWRKIQPTDIQMRINLARGAIEREKTRKIVGKHFGRKQRVARARAVFHHSKNAREKLVQRWDKYTAARDSAFKPIKRRSAHETDAYGRVTRLAGIHEFMGFAEKLTCLKMGLRRPPPQYVLRDNVLGRYIAGRINLELIDLRKRQTFRDRLMFAGSGYVGEGFTGAFVGKDNAAFLSTNVKFLPWEVKYHSDPFRVYATGKNRFGFYANKLSPWWYLQRYFKPKFRRIMNMPHIMFVREFFNWNVTWNETVNRLRDKPFVNLKFQPSNIWSTTAHRYATFFNIGKWDSVYWRTIESNSHAATWSWEYFGAIVYMVFFVILIELARHEIMWRLLDRYPKFTEYLYQQNIRWGKVFPWYWLMCAVAPIFFISIIDLGPDWNCLVDISPYESGAYTPDAFDVSDIDPNLDWDNDVLLISPYLSWLNTLKIPDGHRILYEDNFFDELGSLTDWYGANPLYFNVLKTTNPNYAHTQAIKRHYQRFHPNYRAEFAFAQRGNRVGEFRSLINFTRFGRDTHFTMVTDPRISQMRNALKAEPGYANAPYFIDERDNDDSVQNLLDWFGTPSLHEHDSKTDVYWEWALPYELNFRKHVNEIIVSTLGRGLLQTIVALPYTPLTELIEPIWTRANKKKFYLWPPLARRTKPVSFKMFWDKKIWLRTDSQFSWEEWTDDVWGQRHLAQWWVAERLYYNMFVTPYKTFIPWLDWCRLMHYGSRNTWPKPDLWIKVHDLYDLDMKDIWTGYEDMGADDFSTPEGEDWLRPYHDTFVDVRNFGYVRRKVGNTFLGVRV